MGWLLDLFGLSQEGDRPIFDGTEGKGTQGPAIDIKFDLSSDMQRRFYNILRGIGFDFWPDKVGDPYAIADGRTGGGGDHGPVIFYEPKRAPKEERPPPPGPAPPPGAAMPGYVLCKERARSYVR